MVGIRCKWLQNKWWLPDASGGSRCKWWVPLTRGKYWAPEENGGHWRQLAVAIVECQRKMVDRGVQWQVAEANGGCWSQAMRTKGGRGEWWAVDTNG